MPLKEDLILRSARRARLEGRRLLMRRQTETRSRTCLGSPSCRISMGGAAGRPAMLVFRQLFDPQSSTYTYLLGDRASGASVLIDPVFEQVRRDAALLGELGLKLVATLETHVHADHVTGAWLLKRRTGSPIMLSKASGP